MGYWDKKEPKKKEVELAKEVKEEKYDASEINHDALKEFEEESNESAEKILDNVAGLADDIARQKKQFGDLLSTSYWCAIVFNNTDQKQEFLAKMDFNPTWTFIDGKTFARRCGVKLTNEDRDYSERGKQQAFAQRARPIEKDE